ncbi:TIM barrel protein [Alphaproteobacteria bacterium]|nr:TIM barrel protein [Alphaproteobacteria bacterium]
MIKLSANLSFLFNELPFEKRFNASSVLGFKAVEFLFPYEYKINSIKEWLEEAKQKLILFNTYPGSWENGERGIASIVGREIEFREKFELSIEYASQLDCPFIHVMSGINTKNNMHNKARDIFKENLHYAATSCSKHNITALIEPINDRDIPNYHLNYVDDALNIIKEINHPNLKLQLDLYHAQIMSGDLTNIIKRSIEYTKHIQIASPPYRSDPGTGEINYNFIFNVINNLNYNGYIGCEYKPLDQTVNSLKWAVNFGINNKINN